MVILHWKEDDLSMNRQTVFSSGITRLFYTSLLMISCYAAVGQSVLTQHNNVKRTGWDAGENTLTQASVSGGTFGKLFQINVDDQIYSQPLIVNGVSIGGGTHNIVIITTVNNSVYAVDADNPMPVATPYYWHANLTEPGFRPIQNTDMANSATDGACGGLGSYQDFTGKMGIVGTPVIDEVNKIVYVVARSVKNVNAGDPGPGGTYVQYLHALNLLDGTDKVSPVQIAATLTVNSNTSTFDARLHNQRPALLLSGGIIYIGWASHCDFGNYHGWLLGYQNTGAALSLKYTYNTTADGALGGIWMSGQGPAVDDDGNLFISVGNGTTGNGDPNYTANRGESVVKLSPSLQVLDFFTPENYDYLNQQDWDYGVDGVLLIPNTHLSLSGSKEGYMYLVSTNTGSMGKTAPLNSVPPLNSLQMLNVNASYSNPDKHVHGSPVYYKDDKGQEYAYAWAEDGLLKQFPLTRANPDISQDNSRFDLNNVKIGNTTLPYGMPGALLSVSSNQNVAGTGIIWSSHPINGNAEHNNVPGVLQAFDATDVSHELWNSNLLGVRDTIGLLAKFVPPTIANGKVYMATFSTNLKIYGLNAPSANICPAPALPAAWRSGDIGYLSSPGNVCFTIPNSGTFTVTSAGDDIWDIADGFHSIFQNTSSNDIEIKARVVSVANTGVNGGTGKIGLMFRSNLDPGSPNVFLAINYPLNSGSFTFSNRQTQSATTGGGLAFGSSGTPLGPWIKLTGKNNVYTAYASEDGYSWTQLNTPVTLNLGTNIYLGLAYTTHDNGVSAQAVVDNVTITDNSSPLPVTLVSFTALNKNNQYTQLNWETSAESDFDHFEIEHSTATSSFISIGSVAGHNNTSTDQFYNFGDNSPTDGDNYYRLKMIDKDGKYAYSKVVKVVFNLSSMTLYPNPAKDKIYLKNNIIFTKGENLKIDMINTLSQHILNQSVSTSGLDLITINFPPGLTPGVYFLKATNSSGKKQSWKIVVQN